MITFAENLGYEIFGIGSYFQLDNDRCRRDLFLRSHGAGRAITGGGINDEGNGKGKDV